MWENGANTVCIVRYQQGRAYWVFGELSPERGGLICPKNRIRMLYKPVQTDHGGQLEEPAAAELAQHCGGDRAEDVLRRREIVRGYVQWTSGRRSDARTSSRCWRATRRRRCAHGAFGREASRTHHPQKSAGRLPSHRRSPVSRLVRRAREVPVPIRVQVPLNAPSTVHYPARSNHCFVTHSVA